MFGPRLNTVFRSRWRALWFAASVVVSAWLTIPKQGEEDSQDAAKTVAAFLPGQTPTAPPSKSPWAPDSPAK
jgi:hypothetical protein